MDFLRGSFHKLHRDLKAFALMNSLVCKSTCWPIVQTETV